MNPELHVREKLKGYLDLVDIYKSMEDDSPEDQQEAVFDQLDHLWYEFDDDGQDVLYCCAALGNAVPGMGKNAPSPEVFQAARALIVDALITKIPTSISVGNDDTLVLEWQKGTKTLRAYIGDESSVCVQSGELCENQYIDTTPEVIQKLLIWLNK